MILLGTDAVGHLQKRDPAGIRITAQLDASPDRDVRITSVTAYEMIGGAVALIDRRKREWRDPVPAFRLFQELVGYLSRGEGRILSYDAEAEQIFQTFPPRLRQELKDDARIAAVALANNTAVWTCNATDYVRVPGLAVFRAKTGSQVS